jgi:hypothetical protein
MRVLAVFHQRPIIKALNEQRVYRKVKSTKRLTSLILIFFRWHLKASDALVHRIAIRMHQLTSSAHKMVPKDIEYLLVKNHQLLLRRSYASFVLFAMLLLLIFVVVKYFMICCVWFAQLYTLIYCSKNASAQLLFQASLSYHVKQFTFKQSYLSYMRINDWNKMTR